MGNKNGFNKPVHFNAVHDAEILNHIKRRNFSGYVKKLIREDINTRRAKTPEYEPIQDAQVHPEPKQAIVQPEPVKELTKAERLQQLQQRAKAGSQQPPAPNLFIR